MSDIVTLNGYKIKDEKAVRTYDTIALMKADTKLKEGYHVKTKGYYEANDGGHGEYVIIDDDSLVDDGGSIHVLSNGLRAKLYIENNTVNILQLGAKSDKSADIGSIINSMQSIFNNILIPKGSYLLSTPVVLTETCNIICDDEAMIYPSITNDLFKIETEFCTYKLNIDGTDQETTDNTKYAIVIGNGGYNARHTNLSFSKIQNLKQSGILWENGAFANFTNLYIFTVSGYGIYCSGNYVDNNHGIFTNTEIIYADTLGLLIQKGDSGEYDSRHHVFNNLKLYGCTKGLEIQTNSNIGSVFFEKCSADRTTNNNCGELTSTSKGNKIEIINTVNVWANLVDNGDGNLICGYTNYGFYSFKNIRANSIKIHKEGLTGRLEWTQTTTNEILDTITDTTSNTIVRHNKGTANNRTDIFENVVQIGDYKMSTAKTGVVELSGTLASGASNITAVSTSQSFASGSVVPTVWGTLFFPTGFDNSINIELQTYMIGSAVILKVVNNSSGSVDLTGAKIRWTCINHY